MTARFSFDQVYEAQVAFVWRTLRAMGISEAAVPDAAQDVFVVVHRKLGEFDGRYSVKTWIFHIVYRVACEYRRKSRRTMAEELLDDGVHDGGPGPAEALERQEASSLLGVLLAEMDDEKRAVLILTELEEMTAPEIAAATGTPLNTVYTRLRRARAQFEAALAEWRRRLR